MARSTSRGSTSRRLRVPARGRFRLRGEDADDVEACRGGKTRAEKEIGTLRNELDRLQELLYADHRFALLVVLQGMDTAGKDGTIRHVFAGLNPQGVHVASFRVPTAEESEHDFLWRVHPHAPGRGRIAIFNRSHYEDVLVPRVHPTLSQTAWDARCRAVRAFERSLAVNGTRIVKFFLHIDAKEQRRRLDERRADPHKRWKLSAADERERRYWGRYQKAYEEVIRRTDAAWAPWYIVPSNAKWFRNWAVSRILVETLRTLPLRYPSLPPGIDAGEAR